MAAVLVAALLFNGACCLGLGVRFRKPWAVFGAFFLLSVLVGVSVGGFGGSMLWTMGVIGALIGSVIAQIEFTRRRAPGGYRVSDDA